MNNKKLILTKPPIATYLHHACPLSTISEIDSILTWYVTNYIQLKCISNFEQNNNDLFYDFIVGDVYGGIPWLNYHFYDNSVLYTSENSINKFIQSCIDSNYYMYIQLDEFYVPGRQAYKNKHIAHQNFIYGYDLNNKIYYLTGVNSKGKYICSEITFLQLTNGILGIPQYCSNTFKIMDLKFINNNIFLVKFNRSFKYDFQISNIIDALQDYIESKNISKDTLNTYFDMKTIRDHHVFQSDFSDNKMIVTGMSTYKHLINFIKLMHTNKIEVDIRPLHCLWEHKKCMLERINFLGAHGYLKNSTNILNQYKIIERCTLINRNLILKFILKKDNTLIDKIIDNINDIMDKEYIAIDQILNSLKNI